ncbi:MAG TPA: YciI family protein [Gaiellaceae bacterium]|nr:YciI family protein [Gaiellaceae bacterium]
MQYMLLIYSNEAPERWNALSEAEQQAVLAEYYAISALPTTLAGAQLQPAGTATTVRVENGSTLTTDGPFAETKEVLGGYYLIDVDDLDAALDVAARIPAARLGGSVEVRPVVEMERA